MNFCRSLWAWGTNKMMRRGPFVWVVRMLRVLLTFLSIWRRKKCARGKMTDVDNVKLCKSFKNVDGFCLRSLCCTASALIHHWFQGTEALWNNTPQKSCGFTEVEWTGVYWVGACKNTWNYFRYEYYLVITVSSLDHCVAAWKVQAEIGLYVLLS